MILRRYSHFIIALCATIVRYYDYALFGLSASMLSSEFMPQADDDTQMVSFFAIFSIAVLARPFGSIILGKIGDKIGRIETVKISVLAAAFSTAAIGLIPGFSSLGWISLILLTICRMVFLMSLAGEVDGIRIYVAEKIGAKNRNFANGIVSFSSQSGSILAASMYHFSMSIESITWMWRANFIIGGLLGAIVFTMRGYLKESSVFVNIAEKEKSVEAENNLLEIINKCKKRFILSVIINGIVGSSYHFIVIFLAVFLTKILGVISLQEASYTNIILIAIYANSSLVSGYMADKIPAIKQSLLSLICCSILILIMTISLGSDDFSQISFRFAHYMLAFLVPFFTIPSGIKLQSLFATSVRMRMFSLSHSIGSVLISSTMPFICSLIWKMTGSFHVILLYFMMHISILFFCLIYIEKKNYKNMFLTS